MTGKDQALQAVQAGAGGSLPVYYPTLLLNSSQFAQPPRVYKLMGTNGKRYGAFRMVVRRTNAFGRVLRGPGHHLEEPAHPRQPVRDAEDRRA